MTSASTTGASRGREGGKEEGRKGGRGRKFEMGKSVCSVLQIEDSSSFRGCVC